MGPDGFSFFTEEKLKSFVVAVKEYVEKIGKFRYD
mgnify:CR=1 FL=1